MDFDAFIEGCREQWPSFGNPRKLALSEHPRDRHLAGLLVQIQGLASENKLMLLNLAVSNLAADEVYVEIGCWRGLSLAGAAFANLNANIYACDNFSQFDGLLEDFVCVLKRHTAPGQVRFYDMDFLQFLRLAPWRPARVGAYFYDGGHTFEEQFHALQYMLPHLADDAIVIVDDTNEGPVRSANRLFANSVLPFHLLTDVRTYGNCSSTWWNGIQIYRYYSSSNRSCLPQTGASYFYRRLFWDGIALPVKRVIYTCRVIAGMIPGMRPLYRRIRHLIRSWRVV